MVLTIENNKIRHPEWLIDRWVGQFLNPSDAIVVTGFWRSGTTWLLQSFSRSLRAKSIFEPFHHSIPEYRSSLSLKSGFIEEGSSFLNEFMPFVTAGTHPENQQIRAYLQKVLTSTLPGIWVRESRRGNRKLEGRVPEWRILRLHHRFRDALRMKVVCKFVRGQLTIPALRGWYDPVIIHLRRDPRAVLASLLSSFDLS